MMMNQFALLLVGLLAAAFVQGCGEDDKDNIKVTGVAVPNVEPKVESATPDTLNPGSSLYFVQESSSDPASAIKSRLFSATGPTAIFSILESIDESMASIETRINGQEVGPDEEPGTTSNYLPCLGDIENDEFVRRDGVAEEITFDFNRDGTADLDPDFTVYLNCYDDLTDTSGGTPVENTSTQYFRAFGSRGSGTDELWYIVENSESVNGDTAGTSGLAVEVSRDNDYVNMWFRVGRGDQTDNSKVIAHLVRETSGLIHYTHTGKGVGYGCGLYGTISRADGLAYFVAATDQETNGESGVECGDFSGDTDKTFCVDISSSTFSVNSSNSACSSAGLTTFPYDALDYNLVGFENSVHAFNGSVPSGVTIFKGADTPEED